LQILINFKEFEENSIFSKIIEFLGFFINSYVFERTQGLDWKL